MLKKKIKLGVIGGGVNSSIGKAHFSALSMDGLFEITSGFFSRNKQINKKTIDYLALADSRVFSNFDEYLNSYEFNDADAILILSPTHNHFEHLTKIINLKKTIICEKPSCANFKDFEKLKKKISRNNVKFFLTYNYLGYPIIRDIKRILFEKKIGKILKVELSMPQQGLTTSKISHVKKWRLKDREIPTIQLDLGVHLLSILFFLFPKVKIFEVLGHFRKIKNLDLIHSVDAFMKLENEIFCAYSISKFEVGKRNDLSINIFGDIGSLSWNHNKPEILIMHDQKGSRRVLDRNDSLLSVSQEKRYNRYTVGHPHGFIEALSNVYYDIFHSIVSSQKEKYINNLVSIDEESLIFKTLFSLQESFLKNRWIKN